jgi:succinate-semialdehyde dehydrogenase/glutarate-semialdehyde dehydrogenase
MLFLPDKFLEKRMSLLLKDPSLLATGAYINGEWIQADSGETLAVTNPSTGEIIAEVAKCGAAETRRAIEAAYRVRKSALRCCEVGSI